MDYFDVAHLSVEKLLREWRWLCPQEVSIVARNVFGDLFLCDQAGKILWLDVASGGLSDVADSLQTFRAKSDSAEMREKWFALKDEQQAAQRGLVPGPEQCIGFAPPLAFAESGSAKKPYVADIYDYIPFLGDIHRQISELPDGAKVRLVFKD